MSKFLMSVAVAALMSGPALAQSDEAPRASAGDQTSQSTRQGAAQPTQTNTAQEMAETLSEEELTEVLDAQYAWSDDHEWLRAAVYGEEGEQIGFIERVRMHADNDDMVRAIVVNTDGFLDKGMRHIPLLTRDVTVITEDNLPAGWTVSRDEAGTRANNSGENRADGDGEAETERRWWNFGRDDNGAQSANAMDRFTLITLDFTDDEIAQMTEYTVPQPEPEMASRDTTARTGAQTGAQARTNVASDTSTGAEARMGPATAVRSDRERQTAEADTRTAMRSESGDDAAARAAHQTSGSATHRTGEQASGASERASQEAAAQNRDQRTAMASAASGQNWTESNQLVGRDVYAQDDTRLGSVSRVQQTGSGTQAEPIALIIVTDTMGARNVSLEGRDWSNEERDGQEALTLDYENRGEFEQNSSPYSQDDSAESSSAMGAWMDDDSYDGANDAMGNQETAYGSDDDNTGARTDRWTDDHDWIGVAVYSRTGEQIGEIERVRAGAEGSQPTAIVIETGGFLEIGGREVELNGSNFRLTEYEGEEVLQVRYTEDELNQMKAFNEADASDYPLSDNPAEDDESEPLDDGQQ